MFCYIYVTLGEFYICASPSYVQFSKSELLKLQFHKIIKVY